MAQFDPEERRGLASRAWLAPVAVAVAAVVGVGAGSVATRMFVPRVVTQTVERPPTALELAQACPAEAPAPAPEAAPDLHRQLDMATAQVDDLTSEIKDKQTKIADLEREMARRASAGADLVKQLGDAKQELVIVKKRLTEALANEDLLQAELTTTSQALDTQKKTTAEVRTELVDTKWESFVEKSQLDVCERGTRKRVGHCRQDVVAALDDDIHQQFTHCLRAGQEPPDIHEGVKELPTFSQWLTPSDRDVKGWYVQLCDPSLPESSQTEASAEAPHVVTKIASTTP